LFRATGSSGCQVVSNVKINSTADAFCAVPEPVSAILTGSALLLLVFVIRPIRTGAGRPSRTV
jgi:hypothetical protein